MKMQPMLLGIVAPASLLASSLAAAAHPDLDPYALEPCINGGVSATGLFASQAEEDRYLAQQRRYERNYLQALELEPCINGGVSATGLFASQAEEDAAMRRLERIVGN